MPEFYPSEPISWYGRYARIPGELTAFRVVLHDGEWWPVVDWSSPDGDETGRGLLENRQRAMALARAVNQAKRQMRGQNGGSFLINEFGQVLVPSSRGNGERRFAGVWDGELKFSNPFAPQEELVLTSDTGLNSGDLWSGPYVGMMYQLSRRHEIYFWHQTGDEACKHVPERQDQRLISALKVDSRFKWLPFSCESGRNCADTETEFADEALVTRLCRSHQSADVVHTSGAG